MGFPTWCMCVIIILFTRHLDLGSAANQAMFHKYVVKLSFSPLTPSAKPIRCTGVIYTKEWIITAGKCAAPAQMMVKGKPSHDFGDINLEDEEPTSRATCKPETIAKVRYVVDAVTPPPNEGRTDVPEDFQIALVRLNKPLNLPRRFKPMRLPQNETNCDGAEGDFLGYGAKGDESWSPKFRTFSLENETDAECGKADPSFNAESSFCMRRRTEGESTCGGDVGGPLVKMVKMGLKQAPVTQFVPVHCGMLLQSHCEKPLSEGVEFYAKTFPYTNWIETTAGLQDQ